MSSNKPIYRWWVLFSCTMVFTLGLGMGWTYIIMAVSSVVDDLHLPLTDWGTLWAAISFGTLLFAAMGGALGDRFGVRRVVGLGLLLMGTTLVMRGSASGFWSMYVWMMLFGVSIALIFPNVPKALGMWFEPHELGLANGITIAGYGAGGGLAGALTPWLLHILGNWRHLSVTLGWTIAVLGLLWLFSIRDHHQAGAEKQQPKSMREALRHVLRLKDVWLIAGCYLLSMGGYLGVIGYAPTYLVNEQGVSPERAGFVILLVLWSNMAGSLLFPVISDKIGLRKIVCVPGLVLAGIFIYLAAYAVGPVLSIVAVLWGFTAGVSPIIFVVPLEMQDVGPEHAGSAVGFALSASYLGGVIMPVIGMRLVALNPVAGFAFWGASFGLSGLVFLLLKETGPGRRKALPAAPVLPGSHVP